RRRHTRSKRDWSSDVCSSDLAQSFLVRQEVSLQLFFESVAKELTFQAKRLACYDEIVAAFGLEQLLSRHPQSLSGGEKQRVVIEIGRASCRERMDRSEGE